MSEKEFALTKTKVEDFCRGVGPVLQKKLEERASQSKNWVILNELLLLDFMKGNYTYNAELFSCIVRLCNINIESLNVECANLNIICDPMSNSV